MTTSYMRELVDLAYTLSFSETAQHMHISVSALSKHLNSIESELGVQLFIRTRHNVQITSIGKNFCEEIKKILQAYDAATYKLRNQTEQEGCILRIGYLDSAVHDILRKTIPQFTKQYPSIKLLFVAGQLGDIERNFRKREIDICISILFSNQVLTPNTTFYPLYTDTVAAVIPSENPLSQRDFVHFEELLPYPLGLPDANKFPSFASLLEQQLLELPDKANIVRYFEITSATLLAESSMAITFLPGHLCQYPNSARFIPIIDSAFQFQVGVFCLTSNRAMGVFPFIEELSKISRNLPLPPR